MLTPFDLETLRAEEIDGSDIDKLKDISAIKIEKNSSVEQRIMSFLMQIGNPYLFKVDDTAVKIRFAKDGPTLQSCLEKILIK